jgi:CRP-like cAMP-binding protein
MTLKNTNFIKENLKHHHLFSKLTELQLDRVYQHSKLHRLSEGEILFNQGEQVRAFYMVLSGGVKLFRMSADGQEKIIEIVKPGQVFAEALMFTDQTDYPVSSAALSDTEVLSINAKYFKNMLLDSTDTCLLLLGAMSLRLRTLVNEIDKLTLHSGTCRVASYLVQEQPEGQKKFKLEVAKNIIAARLSIKPETFSRIIKNLKDQGILSIDGNSVTIHDFDKLKQQSLL